MLTLYQVDCLALSILKSNTSAKIWLQFTSLYFKWHLLYYAQKSTTSIKCLFSDQQLQIWKVLKSSVQNCLSQLQFQ